MREVIKKGQEEERRHRKSNSSTAGSENVGIDAIWALYRRRVEAGQIFVYLLGC